MSANENKPGGEVILYQTEDLQTRVQVRLDGQTAWLSLNELAELFQRDKSVISKHLKNIFEEGELSAAATVANFATVQTEGGRKVARNIEFYNLDAIIAVGYRVKSARGTRFRIWATARLKEYLVKGFTMDDERLKNPPGKGQTDYFDELLARIRDIRSSERRFYQKVLDIYATSVDYTPDAEVSQKFFATVQNKMHWATHGHTAAEIIHKRADAGKPFMGMLTTRPGGRVRKEDAAIAKNYLTEDELHRIRGVAGAGTETDDDARLDHEAGRVPENLRAQAAGSRRDDFPRAGGQKGGTGIFQIPRAGRCETVAGGNRF
jgi:hypothetical protein